MLFERKKDAFLFVINIILTELRKPRCNAFHSYDDADIDITK